MSITIVTIIDENDFGKALMIRPFTDPMAARAWASHQIVAIRRALADKGEDLLDIEAKFTDYADSEIDNSELVVRPAHIWRVGL